jgi:DDE superfamily endonuclease
MRLIARWSCSTTLFRYFDCRILIGTSRSALIAFSPARFAPLLSIVTVSGYAVGIQSSTRVWPPGLAPLPAKTSTGEAGRPRSLQRRVPGHSPVAVKDLALALEPSCYHTVSWREGTRSALSSRFAALRVRTSHWIPASRMSGRVASRRNVTRRVVVVPLSFFLFFRGLPGAKRPAPGGFQLFRRSHFSRRFGRVVQAPQDHFSHAFGAPCLDPSLQRS